jgi:pyrroline-5-carboxylate reductase
MRTKFSPNVNLPDYLEEVLAPFSVSGVFSKEFRNAFALVIFSNPESRPVVASKLIDAITVLEFLSPAFRVKLISALERFGREGFKK